MGKNRHHIENRGIPGNELREQYEPYTQVLTWEDTNAGLYAESGVTTARHIPWVEWCKLEYDPQWEMQYRGLLRQALYARGMNRDEVDFQTWRWDWYRSTDGKQTIAIYTGKALPTRFHRPPPPPAPRPSLLSQLWLLLTGSWVRDDYMPEED